MDYNNRVYRLRNCSHSYRGADKSLARPTSRCICLMVRIFRLMLVLFYIYIYITNIPPIMIINRIYETQNISFDASLVIYINSTNIPPIMIENQNLLSL